MEYYVYVLYRPWDGRPCYVGKGKGPRWLEHEKLAGNHYNFLLAGVFKKAARLGLVVRKEKRYRGLTEAEAHQCEVGLIKSIGRYPNGPLANLTDGGDGCSGLVFSPETRAKMSAVAKGRKPSPACLAALRGRKLSPEHRAAVSAGNKGKVVSQETREKIRATRLGVKRPDLSLSQLGRTFSPETRAKMRAAKLGKKQKPEHVKKRIAAIRRRHKSM